MKALIRPAMQRKPSCRHEVTAPGCGQQTKPPGLWRWCAAAAVILWPTIALASGLNDHEAGPGHRVVVFVIQVGVIIFAAKIGNILFKKARLPGALGELFAGIVIGSYALGRLGFYGFARGLFPPAGAGVFPLSPELYGLSAIAAIVLLFNVGIETNLRMLLRFAFAGGLVGLGGVVVSFFAGAGSVVLFSESLFGHKVGLLAPAALFAGVVATATSVGITARVLSERQKLDSPEGVTILSAAVIDDVLGIILLAAVMSVVTAKRAAGAIDWGHTGIVAVRAIGVWLGATVIGLVAARKISFLLKWFGERTSIAIMALGMALVLAGLFEEAGLAMIIGAYVMGLSLSRADISYVVREKLSTVYALLVPIFFCTMGMLIDLTVLTSPGVLIFGAVFTAAALLAKVVGCGAASFFADFNLRGAARVGFGMAPRCEVALIIAGIGLAAGLLNPQIFAAVVMMVLVNSVIAPAALVFLFRSPAAGTRKPVPAAKPGASVSFEFPSIEMTEFFIGKLAAVFDAEGFYVHKLSRDLSLHQARKEQSVIDIHLAGTTLTFACRQADVPLVNTAMYEALAAFEQAIRGMKKPLDARSISDRLQEAGPLGPSTLELRNYLTLRLIKARLKGSTKAEVIDELLALLARAGRLKNVKAARKAIWEREESMSTGLQYGVAIPHGKTDAVEGLVCAVGLKPDGVTFESLDGKPARIFILTLSPKTKPAPHIQFMSTISQILSSEGRRRILACKNAKEVYTIFTQPARPAPAPPARPMPSAFKLSDYIGPELIEPDLKGDTKDQVLFELLELLDRSGQVSDIDVAAKAVLDREAQMSTGMEDGIAVPHGRTDAVENLVCAVGVHREGIDFKSADGKPSNIFLLVLTPEAGADPYLQFVAWIMGVLDADGRGRVLSARSAEQIYEALTGIRAGG